MEELSLADYRRIIAGLARTVSGKAIARREVSFYPAPQLVSDLAAIEGELRLKEISLLRMADYAELLGQAREGVRSPSLHDVVGEACRNLIRLGRLAA